MKQFIINNKRSLLYLPFVTDLNDHNNSGIINTVSNTNVVLSNKAAQFNGTNSFLRINNSNLWNDFNIYVAFTTDALNSDGIIFSGNYVDSKFFHLSIVGGSMFLNLNGSTTVLATVTANTTYYMNVYSGNFGFNTANVIYSLADNNGVITVGTKTKNTFNHTIMYLGKFYNNTFYFAGKIHYFLVSIESMNYRGTQNFNKENLGL